MRLIEPKLRAGAILALALILLDARQPAFAGDLNVALSGRTAFEAGKSYRPWRQFFAADGNTVYFGDGPSSLGKWEVRGSQFCSLWPPSTKWACYDVELSPSSAPFLSIVWIGKDGTREGADLFSGDQTQLRAPPKR